MSRLLARLTPMRPFGLREVDRLDLMLQAPTRLPAAIREALTRDEFVDRLRASGARIKYRA